MSPHFLTRKHGMMLSTSCPNQDNGTFRGTFVATKPKTLKPKHDLFLILTLTKKTLTNIWWLHVEVEQKVWFLLVPFTTFYVMSGIDMVTGPFDLWMCFFSLHPPHSPFLCPLFPSPCYFFPSSGSLWGFSLQQVAGQSAEASLAVWHHGNRLWQQHSHACAQTNVNTNTDKCTLVCQRKGHEREYKLRYPRAHGS